MDCELKDSKEQTREDLPLSPENGYPRVHKYMKRLPCEFGLGLFAVGGKIKTGEFTDFWPPSLEGSHLKALSWEEIYQLPPEQRKIFIHFCYAHGIDGKFYGPLTQNMQMRISPSGRITPVIPILGRIA